MRTRTRNGFRQLKRIATGLWLSMLMVSSARAELDWNNPTALFTNFATRLLQSELGVTYSRIPIWPTNQYTPALHRLLQVSANLVEATTNRIEFGEPALPTVFVPQFTNVSGTIFITGYEETTDAKPFLAPWRDLRDPADRDALEPKNNVRGIPWIIGARKGLPHFNEFSLQPVVTLARRLQLVRKLGPRLIQTNQTYVLSVSNLFGVEAWNSSSNAYPREIRVICSVRINATITNETGLVLLSNSVVVATTTNFLPGAWAGFTGGTDSASLLVPLASNVVVLPESHWTSQHGFTTSSNEFESSFPIPQWKLTTDASVLLLMEDLVSGRVVDCVNLVGMGTMLDVGAALIGVTGFVEPNINDAMWITNRLGGVTSDLVQTLGISNQVVASLGLFGWDVYYWGYFSANRLTREEQEKAIDQFRVFLGFWPIHFPLNQLTNPGTAMEAPFVPCRCITQMLSWQVNDPLVHYLLADLTDLSARDGVVWITSPHIVPIRNNLGQLNRRYAPWGGNPSLDPYADKSRYNSALKDPLVFRSDDWDFPQGGALDLRQIGRIHRGTPWQTVYLKSADVDIEAWRLWTRNDLMDATTHQPEALRSRPVHDRALVNLLASLLNTNDPLQRLSINNPSTNAWLNALNGLTVLTITSTDAELAAVNPAIHFEIISIDGSSELAASVVSAIAQCRAAQRGGVFLGVGDVLAVPELSDASPWLSRSNLTQLPLGISDEAYEALPSQLLPLLRPDPMGSATVEGGLLRIRFSGFAGFPLALEASPDLRHWTAIQTNMATEAGVEFLLTTTETPQFFRARQFAPAPR